jgi:hypothetical protein
LLGNPSVSRTFTSRKDAYTWAQLTALNLSRRRAGLQDERTLQIPLSDLLTGVLRHSCWQWGQLRNSWEYPSTTKWQNCKFVSASAVVSFIITTAGFVAAALMVL